jgi:hypothetical protein
MQEGNMQIVALNLVLLLILSLSSLLHASAVTGSKSETALGSRQLLAVRGEVVSLKAERKGMIAITVRPRSEFAEVTVVARENEMVGNSAGRGGGADLLGLLANEESREDEKISAAELQEGDVVSVIYDPQIQNRALEIYMH